MNHSALSYLPKMEKPTKQIKTFPKETRLLNDTTIEQMNSMRPDGTYIPTGFQSRGYYINNGKEPE